MFAKSIRNSQGRMFIISYRNSLALITEKYPQIKKLFGYDPNFKWVVTCMVLVQLAMLFVMRDRSWPITLLVGYCFGGVINHSLMLGKILFPNELIPMFTYFNWCNYLMLMSQMSQLVLYAIDKSGSSNSTVFNERVMICYSWGSVWHKA